MKNKMRLIDVKAFREFWNNNYRHQYANENFLFALANFPTVDAVEVVRCKDCKHWNKHYAACNHFNAMVHADVNGFCSYGERKDND